MIHYTYWRSTAAYRLRIALNLKGAPHESAYVHLSRGGGEHRQAAYRAKNPQVFHARRFDCDLSAYPTITAIDARLTARPAFAAAEPLAQEDAEPDNDPG